jgi:hypothetical protein
MRSIPLHARLAVIVLAVTILASCAGDGGEPQINPKSPNIGTITKVACDGSSDDLLTPSYASSRPSNNYTALVGTAGERKLKRGCAVDPSYVGIDPAGAPAPLAPTTLAQIFGQGKEYHPPAKSRSSTTPDRLRHRRRHQPTR